MIMNDTKSTLKKKSTYTLTLSNGNGSDEKREVKAYDVLWAVTEMQHDIEYNWHNKAMRVVAVREGYMFTPEEEEELNREKDWLRCH